MSKMATMADLHMRLERLRHIMAYAQLKVACVLCHKAECDCWEPVAWAIKETEAELYQWNEAVP